MKEKKTQDINRLRIVLAEKNVKQNELAKKLKKTPLAVSRWCSNISQPSLKTLRKVAFFLDVDVRELLAPTKEK